MLLMKVFTFIEVANTSGLLMKAVTRIEVAHSLSFTVVCLWRWLLLMRWLIY